MNPYLKFHPEVQSAVASGQPVVALESTIISHGMPYPKNIETALAVQKTVRDHGAVPATMGVVNGQLKVGMDDDLIHRFGKEGRSIIKVNRRDLPYVINSRQMGSTTVAGTMVIAEMAGIPVMATGGIGGVHRGAPESMDISADLIELSKTSVAVVCAGFKYILDPNLTMEYLETFSVPVLGYETSDLPAFYTRKSGVKLSLSMDTAADIAHFCRTKWKMGLVGGVVIANPIARESSLPKILLDTALQNALRDARQNNISGKDVTPFLLEAMGRETGGRTLKANVDLILGNAVLAAKIAKSLKEHFDE